jgi:hypothetical protein
MMTTQSATSTSAPSTLPPRLVLQVRSGWQAIDFAEL